jgi:hypothetical protein
MSVTDALPVYHHHERHAIRVAAPPAAALEAARTVSLADLALVRLLLRLRGLGRGGSSAPVWDALLAEGFQPFGDDTLVLVGKPWRLRGGLRRVDDFVAFAEPGYAKMAVDLRATAAGGGSVLETETRVFLTDRSARRRFAAYWLVVRPFSGLIRRSWLSEAKRRAEA